MRQSAAALRGLRLGTCWLALVLSWAVGAVAQGASSEAPARAAGTTPTADSQPPVEEVPSTFLSRATEARPATAPMAVRPLTLPKQTLVWGELVVPQNPRWQPPVLHSLGLMTGMRLTEAWLWPDPFAETRLDVIGDRYREAFTRPPKWDSDQAFFEWDGDPWYINAVGHAALGAELYYRPRACGHGPLAALGFAAVGAAVWDYAYEGNGVRPSALDLWYTPLSGALIGEARYWGYRAAGSISSRTWRVVLQTLVDPFGQLERSLGTSC